MQDLRDFISLVLTEQFRSHTLEPDVGDIVANDNPNCKHRGSVGKVLSVQELPNDQGKTATYECANSGANWGVGDILTKTLDQLVPAVSKDFAHHIENDLPITECIYRLGSSSFSSFIIECQALIDRGLYSPTLSESYFLRSALLGKYVHSSRRNLAEASTLPEEYFTLIDSAISDSQFWKEPNTQDDIDIYDTSSGSVLGTPSAEALSQALRGALDASGLDMDILVRSHDTDDLEGLTLHPEHPAWPNRWLIDAKWYISKERPGRSTIDIELMTSEDEDDMRSSLQPAALVRHIAQTIRHELVHYHQMKKQAKNKGLDDSAAFEEMMNDPSQVPPADLDNEEWQKEYLGSHIEIDAHAHDAAEELLAVYTDAEINDILKGSPDLSDPDMPNAILHYFRVLGPSDKSTQKFLSKLYTQVERMK